MHSLAHRRSANTTPELFRSTLPRKPYCSNDKSARFIRPRGVALGHDYIQCNEPAFLRWIIVDIDRADAGAAWIDAGLPEPAWITVDVESGRGHIAYGLEAPVCKSAAARIKPLEYAAAVRRGLCHALGGDPGYTGLIAKNPLSDKWATLWASGAAGGVYSLGELAEYVELIDKQAAANDSDGCSDEGRNCALFDSLRFWAYSEIWTYRGGTIDVWENAVLDEAEAQNSTFDEPMLFSEVRGIARSVARWIWKRDGRAESAFRERQSKKGRAGGLSGGRGRTTADAAKRRTAADMRAQGMTQADIAQRLGVTSRTIRNWLNNKTNNTSNAEARTDRKIALNQGISRQGRSCEAKSVAVAPQAIPGGSGLQGRSVGQAVGKCGQVGDSLPVPGLSTRPAKRVSMPVHTQGRPPRLDSTSDRGSGQEKQSPGSRPAHCASRELARFHLDKIKGILEQNNVSSE